MVGEPGLVAYWNFDDGTAKDLTGNGNNGTLVGGASIVPILGPDVIHAGCLATAPIITKEPQSQVLLVDEGTSLSVVAHGNGRLAFQWYVGVSGDKSNPVPGATNSVLAVSPLYVSVNFWVFVSDLFGTVNSATAVIRALPVSTPRLNIEMAAGLPFLSIEGLVGTAYRIQYATEVTNKNWTTLLGLTLPSSPFTFSDTSASTNSIRFYRAVTP